MRLVIAAVGRSRRDATRELYEDYAGRLPWPVELKEIEERKPLPTAERIKREGERLLAALPEGATMVALDGGGRELSSTALAKTLGLCPQQLGAPPIPWVLQGPWPPLLGGEIHSREARGE